MTATIIETIAVILLSGFFSGMEIAFVSSSQLRIEIDKADNHGPVNHALSVFYSRPNNFISTILVGNNIVLVIYSILMTTIIENAILHPLNIQLSEAVLLILETIVSTFIMLVMGEFLPKTIFRIRPEQTMRIMALPAYFFHIILFPLSRFTTLLSRLMLRLVGVKIQSKRAKPVFKKADLDHLVETSLQEGSASAGEDQKEIKIFQNALQFRRVKVRECIVPRTEIDAVSIHDSLETLRNRFIESGHSKVIIYREDIDDIVGFVHSRELFKQTDSEDWTHAILEAPVVPETMSAQRLMQDLLKEHRSLAIVVDEFGGTSGIVTLEDLVEEIFGEIRDEHDHEEHVAKQTGPNEYLLSARLEIDEVNELLSLSLPTSEDYMTIGGLILQRHQSLPRCNEVISFDNFEFRIIKSSSTKIELVKLKVLADSQ